MTENNSVSRHLGAAVEAGRTLPPMISLQKIAILFALYMMLCVCVRDCTRGISTSLCYIYPLVPFTIGSKVDMWLFMGSPVPVLAIIACYLVFVLKIGPLYMVNREPFSLKYIMMFYNFNQIMYNSWLFIQVFVTEGAIDYMVKHTCHPMKEEENPLRMVLFSAAWHYFFTKILDLLDTVFFVLRKKQSHVTFLHLYHHTIMVLSTWAYLKYIRGEQGGYIGLVNSGVHVIMYSYYFLAAFGPRVQKHLWWKKYITRLQLAQFLFIIVFMCSLLVFNCALPRRFTYYSIANGCIFIYLFSQFYIKAYCKPKDKGNSLVE